MMGGGGSTMKSSILMTDGIHGIVEGGDSTGSTKGVEVFPLLGKKV